MSGRMRPIRNRPRPRRRRRLLPFAAGGALVAVAALAGAFAWILAFDGDGGPDVPTAVIVDQLELTYPNPDFVEEATAKLERAGYQVDYIPGEEVTVDFYRDLPRKGYDVLLFRAHAGRNYVEGEPTSDTSLFTAEPYSRSAHLDDQRERRLRVAFYTPQDFEEEETYFAVAPAFVRESMHGDFDGATVILMGCDVLRGDQLASALRERGAGTIIGWDEEVSARHTDLATARLLDLLLFEGAPPGRAVAQTMEELGPDPAFGAELVMYRE